jgi:uncharacterized coiled-coil DUF342 family protein
VISVSLVIGWIVAASGVLGTIAGLAKIGVERRKLKADVERVGVDSAKILSETAMSLLQPSIDQINYLRTELVAARSESKAAREESEELRKEIAELRNELSELRSAQRENNNNGGPADPLIIK